MDAQGHKSDAILMNLDEIKGLISKEILECSAAMKSYEKPLKWDYELELFSLENNFLTPKLSLRRNNVMKVYGAKVLALYNENMESGVTIRKYVVNGLEHHD